MAKFFRGAAVVQKLPAPIEGVVTRFEADQVSGDVQVCVEYTDSEGKVATRYFHPDELELKPEELELKPEEPAVDPEPEEGTGE